MSTIFVDVVTVDRLSICFHENISYEVTFLISKFGVFMSNDKHQNDGADFEKSYDNLLTGNIGEISIP
ncbi:hypothetical protein T4D_16949 [Trichinella pseudospiralis]|uniref:Uncharacterized protein n=1 Tax=Trichinella pseudospiralis TaxID=6337 RepID=A0A0V1FUR7_TRIPS|nr:hypothetical protein T4D_16949 [Trichinella pseudospiralis]